MTRSVVCPLAKLSTSSSMSGRSIFCSIANEMLEVGRVPSDSDEWCTACAQAVKAAADAAAKNEAARGVHP